jgi:hypothetical protein
MKRSSSASSDSSDSDSDSAAENKKKREELAEEDLWQHLTYWTLEEEEEEDSEQEVMDQDNGRVFAKIYTVDAENGATTEQLIELFDPFFDDGGVTDSELMMVCLVSGSLYL